MNATVIFHFYIYIYIYIISGMKLKTHHHCNMPHDKRQVLLAPKPSVALQQAKRTKTNKKNTQVCLLVARLEIGQRHKVLQGVTQGK